MKKVTVAKNGRLQLGGQFATKKEVMKAIAEDLLAKKAQGEDLRVEPAFEFVPGLEPRVTKGATLDIRYNPTGKTQTGRADLRFGSARATQAA